MEKIRLGRTELYVTKTAFGALPIQRISRADAVKLVRRAYDSGINYFDTANMYTDSEEKLGEALHDVRANVVISTKTAATDKKTALAHMEQSLRSLRTDYIDLIQFHNPAKLPDIEDPDGAFAAALEMQKKGHVRHIGITNHRLGVAREAIASGNFETLQFPFCYLTTEKELELVDRCKAADMGYIAMKGLSGGLLNNAEACYCFMKQFDNVVPIWGPAGAGGEFLPQLRLLPALRRRDRHPPGRPDVGAAAPLPLPALHERRVVRQDAQDRGVRPL